MTAVPRPWRAALSVFRIKALEGIQYRFALLSGSVVSVFWSLIEITVYIVFFAHSERAGTDVGMTLAQMVSYSWLGQVLFAMQPMSLDPAIQKQIENGDIGIELCRPFPIYNHWFARSLSWSLTTMLLRGLPVALAGLLMPVQYRLGGPVSIAALGCALVSVMCAALLCASWANVAAAVRMKVELGNGPMYIVLLIGGVLSGGYLPLRLWPDFLQTFLLFQPFAGYLDIPMRLYLGLLPVSDAWFYWAVQLTWTGIFIITGKLMIRARLRRIVVQGG